MIILSSCDKVHSYKYKFIGESDHWIAEYNYRGIETWEDEENKGNKNYSNIDKYKFRIKYKGSLSSLKKIEFTYEAEASGRTGTYSDEFLEPPKQLYFESRGNGSGGLKISKDEVIKVRVKWDNHEEFFELRNRDNEFK